MIRRSLRAYWAWWPISWRVFWPLMGAYLAGVAFEVGPVATVAFWILMVLAGPHLLYDVWRWARGTRRTRRFVVGPGLPVTAGSAGGGVLLAAHVPGAVFAVYALAMFAAVMFAYPWQMRLKRRWAEEDEARAHQARLERELAEPVVGTLLDPPTAEELERAGRQFLDETVLERPVGEIEVCGATPDGDYDVDKGGSVTWAADPFVHWGAYAVCMLPPGHGVGQGLAVDEYDPVTRGTVTVPSLHSWQAVLECSRCLGAIRPGEPVDVGTFGARHPAGTEGCRDRP